MNELLSIADASKRLGLKAVTLRLWAGARRIGSVKLGRRVLIPSSEIERLIQESYRPPRPITKRDRDAQ